MIAMRLPRCHPSVVHFILTTPFTPPASHIIVVMRHKYSPCRWLEAPIHGATEVFGFTVAENPVHVRDLHATAPHLMGMAREKLTYRYAGRDFRLSNVEGRVVKAIVA